VDFDGVTRLNRIRYATINRGVWALSRGPVGVEERESNESQRRDSTLVEPLLESRIEGDRWGGW
jgi:hypothetical protein